MTTKKNDSPLSRWSQRKMLVQEGKIPSDVSPKQSVPPETEMQSASPSELDCEPNETGELQQAPQPQEDEVDSEKFADVDYDALDYESDYTQFMAKNVPEMVKRRALRALWSSDPVFANLDGLNDYDEDFTDAVALTKGIESAWNVGKGYMTDEQEQQNERDGEDDLASADDSDGESDAIEKVVDDQEGDGKGTQNIEADALRDNLDKKIETS